MSNYICQGCYQNVIANEVTRRCLGCDFAEQSVTPVEERCHAECSDFCHRAYSGEDYLERSRH